MGKVDSRDLFAWNPISVPTMSGRIGGVQMTFLTQRTGSVLEYSEQVQLVHNLTANVYEIDSFHVFIINELVDTNEIKN